jgi:Putative beta-barrel porin-2, OmpL-like. bbp2
MAPVRSVAASVLLASVALVPNYAPAQQAQPPSDAASTTAPSADSAAAPASGTSALNDLLAPTGITATGYLAASYYYSNDDSTYHEFDTAHDTLQIDQAAITLAYQPKAGFGALVNLMAGEDARFINEQQNGTHGAFDVTQAFLQYAKGPLTIIGGRFLTLVGAESESPALNTNFSRSLVYFAEPITHTGVRATYAATDTVSVIIGVNEGWNTISNSYGSKTGEFSLQYTPNKIVSFSAQGYIGKDQAYDATRSLIDVIATYNATASLTLILNYDWGQQQQRPLLDADRPNLNWNAAAGYVNYAFNSEWRISLRGEVLDDQGGFVTGTPETIEEGTVTLGYAPLKSFEARLEARYDTSNQATFEYKTPNTDTFDSHQTGFALQGIYKF